MVVKKNIKTREQVLQEVADILCGNQGSSNYNYGT